MALTALTLLKTFGREKFSIRTTFHNDTIILHSIEKVTVCSSASDSEFPLHIFDDVRKYNTGKCLLCFFENWREP